MTQLEFDRRFDRIVKTGFALLLSGIALAILVGAPVALLTDDFRVFFVAAALGIAGGCVCTSAFAHDIFCNPRWKR